MSGHTRLYNSIIFLFISVILFCFRTNIYAETFYKWVDQDGILQYSNQPPKDYQEGDPNVEIIEESPQLSKKGAFTLIERKPKKKPVQIIPDEHWKIKFSEFNENPPELPKQKEIALNKLNKIIADETVYLEKTINNYHKYLIEYDKRKRQHEKEVEKHKEKIDLKIWRTPPLESVEEFMKNKSTFERKIKYHKLLLQWTLQKKHELEEEVSQNKIPR